MLHHAKNGKSRVRFPMRSQIFSINQFLPAALGPGVKPLIEMSTRIIFLEV
jgi:hypothetical protein